MVTGRDAQTREIDKETQRGKERGKNKERREDGHRQTHLSRQRTDVLSMY